MNRAIVLVDGEHYPPVTRQAVEHLSSRYTFVAAVFLGGREKLAGPLDVGLPLVEEASQREALETALERYRPEVVVDLSDAPVLGADARFLLASVALAAGARYEGADFRFDPPPRPTLTKQPTIAVIGTGKRTGKTAIAASLARHAVMRGVRPVIVAMGRGGPATPVVIRGDLEPPGAFDLLQRATAGEHAASDSFEDAVIARVTTVGARRAGAGLAGAPFVHTVAEAIAVAEAEQPDLIILEGSGTAVPPARAAATVLVAGGATPARELRAGLALFRLLIADLVLVTMAEEPVLSSETLSALDSSLRELARDVPVVRTVFRPAPLGRVSGRTTFVATTAPEAAREALVRHLQHEHGAKVVGVTHRLAERDGLRLDLARAEGTYEVLLTELKAAAVDVAARAAIEAGAEVVFLDNRPLAELNVLERAYDTVLQKAGV